MTKTIRYIGDVHANFGLYQFCTMDCERSIQVGDFGMGFADPVDVGENHRFIRGNHDDPALCRAHPNWIPDGYVEDNMFFIGGAYSIDRAYRTEGVDWWPDEELSYVQLENLIDQYERVRPEIMVTHDCPDSVRIQLFQRTMKIRSRTGDALDAMLQIHRPKVWVFGHHHEDRDVVLDGTRFICLAELSYIDLEV